MKYCRYTEIGYDSSILLVEWIPELVHRRLQHLVLENRVVPLDLDIMPDCIYLSKTLVSLKLVSVAFKELKFAVFLPCLKILHLEENAFLHDDYFCYNDYVSDGGRSIIENLISGSPVLENVTLEASIEDWIERTNVPQCLSSTLEFVKIGVNIVMTEAGIKLANYFLENSAILKKLSLSCKYFLKDNKTEAESYKKLLTSTKLSPTCQVLVD